MSPEVVRIGEAPTSLVEVLPAITRPVVYRYLRQTTRTNNDAPVAAGALKPTSVYGLTQVDGRLHVIAHLSEPMDKFLLQDTSSLADFVRLEMVSGIHSAVETQLVSGDGTGENLTGLSNTSGIQTQLVFQIDQEPRRIGVLAHQPPVARHDRIDRADGLGRGG